MVEHTAFVDNVFFSATPSVQDEANPFQTISAALTAINTARGAGTTPWKVIVRPGTFTENITTLTNVDIYGAGVTTIINGGFTNPLGGGPAMLSDMLVNVPSTLNVIVEDTLSIQNSQWFFTPSSNTNSDCFRLTGTGSPSLTMFRCYISELPANPTSIYTGFFQMNMEGPSMTLDVSECTGIQNGTAGGNVAFGSITGILSANVRNSSFEFIMQDDGMSTEYMVCYGLGGGTGDSQKPYDLRWNIDNVNHTFINGTGSNQVSPTVIGSLDILTFIPGPESCFCFRDCLFQFVDYASTVTNIFSAYDGVTTGNFIQFFDNKWIGLTLPNGTSYVPQRGVTHGLVPRLLLYMRLLVAAEPALLVAAYRLVQQY